MTSMRAATVAYVLARLAFAAGLIAKPDSVAAGWIGDDAARPTAQVALRGLAGRDVALSIGTLTSLGDADRLPAWIAATIGADLSDLAATLSTPPGVLPDNARWGTVALAGAAAAAGAGLLAGLTSR